MKRQDDFPARTKRQLCERVANRCSRPECRKVTIGPQRSASGTINLGKAAHISAASPGGPRYLSDMTSAQRKSFDNGIWLCSGCADRVDRDERAYPIELLNGWKREAEAKASIELDQRLPDRAEIVDTLASAFTGVARRMLPDAISNIHKASSKSFEEIDPRFNVKSSFRNGTTSFEFSARKGPISINLEIDDEGKGYVNMFMRMLDHGEEAKIPGTAFKFVGSPLFEDLNSKRDAVLKVIPRGMKCISRITLIDAVSNVSMPFEDVHGELSFGRKSGRFKGAGCGGMLEMTYSMDMGLSGNGKFSFSVNLDKWKNIDIRRLPYLKKLLDFIDHLDGGWGIHVELELDGIVGLRGTVFIHEDMNYLEATGAILRYTRLAIPIAKYLDIEIPFSEDIAFTKEDFNTLYWLSRIAEGNYEFNADKMSNSGSLSFLVDSASRNYEQFESKPITSIKKIQTDSVATIFNICFPLPPIETDIEHVQLSIANPKDVYVDGEEVRVNIRLTDCSRFSEKFQKEIPH